MSTAALIEAKDLTIASDAQRPLFEGLDLTIARDRVAIVGRNGVGKSTLLAVLAGDREPASGRLVRRGSVLLVPQRLDDDLPMSPGERRRRALAEARDAAPDLLLLDEPTEDLDDDAVAWLCRWVAAWPHGLIAVSHDPRFLASFSHFFVAAETGARYLPGTFEDVQATLERDRTRREAAYLSELSRLAEREWHDTRVTRRRQRKKNLGRIHEVGRSPSKAKLNLKRSYAQESQGRAAKLRGQRMATVRGWVHAARRAMAVDLPLEMLMPDVPQGHDDRIAVVGPNGAGKTTYLTKIIDESPPDRIGVITQGGGNWIVDECLLELLARPANEAAELVVAHRFPLALAERPLRTLSPGERVRAALMALVHRDPVPTTLILDEPSYSLDFLGTKALAHALAAWPGGLLVATHDHALLDAVSWNRRLELTTDR